MRRCLGHSGSEGQGWEPLHMPFQRALPEWNLAGENVQLVVSMFRARPPLLAVGNVGAAHERRHMSGVVAVMGGLDPHKAIAVLAFLAPNHMGGRLADLDNSNQKALPGWGKVPPARYADEPHFVARRVSFAWKVSPCAAMAR